MELILIRGLPGSGKSTIAREMLDGDPDLVHLEADDFFIDPETDEYRFDPTKTRDAHRWCREQVGLALQQGKSVVVANTFTRMWELNPYVEIGDLYGADITIITARGKYTNVHGVPVSTIQKMAERWESLHLQSPEDVT